MKAVQGLLACSLLIAAGAVRAEDPQWLKDAQAREGTLIEPQAIVSKDGWFHAKVPARLMEPIVKQEGSYTLSFDIGAGDAPLFCEVMPDRVDPARMLLASKDSMLKIIAKELGKIDRHELRGTDAGHHAGVPFLGAEWLYLIEVKREKRLGRLRQVVYDRPDASVACWFNEIGYDRSFDAVTHALIESIETHDLPEATNYQEITTVRVAGHLRGYAHSSVVVDSDGDRKVTTSMSMLVPVAGDQVSTRELFHLAWVRPDSTLINAVRVGVNDGETEEDLALKRDDQGRWLVEGKFKGKKVKEVLAAEPSPMTMLAAAARLKSLLAEASPANKYAEWHSWDSVSPLEFLPVKVTALAPAGDNAWSMRMETEQVAVDLTVTRATGMTERAVMRMGAIALEFERVWSQGSIP